MSELSHQIEGAIATITFHNPPQNRQSIGVLEHLEIAVSAIAESGARVVLVRAEGPDFSYGGDITQWTGRTPDELRALFERWFAVYSRFERLAIPTVAAVRGVCFGGGFELALRCDVIIAGASAKFGHPEQTLAITTLMGGVYRLAERAGRSFAAHHAFTSEPISAEVGYARGIVQSVVPDASLEAEARAYVERLSTGPTRAHAAHKTLLRLWALGGVQAADEAILDISMALFETDDVKRGLASAADALARGLPRPILSFEGR